MSPQEPQQPQPPVEFPVSQPVAAPKSHKKLALTLMIAPTALLVLGFVCFLITMALPENAAANGDLYGDNSVAKQILTLVGFVSTGLGTLTWLPGLIIGIVLLAKKK